MKKVLIKSYAKINIALNVNGKNKDGYQDLDMVMVPIKMHDSLLINVLEHRKTDSITVDDFSCRFGGHNLASLAIDELRKKHDFKQMFRVDIHKVIPIKGKKEKAEKHQNLYQPLHQYRFFHNPTVQVEEVMAYWHMYCSF